MGNTKQSNLEIKNKNKNQLRKLEEFYVNGKVSDILSEIEKEKKRLVEDMIKYADEHTEPIKWDKEGNVLKEKVKINPIVITNYFFKPIIPLSSQEPLYNAEKLALVFDYYCQLVAEVNDKIGYFPNSLTSFCKLAGITLNTLRNYRNSEDLNMRIITEKIYDQIGDANITMSQMGIVKERSTLFKMKSQNEMIEKQQPSVHINITEKPDLEKIEARLNKYKQFASKKESKK